MVNGKTKHDRLQSVWRLLGDAGSTRSPLNFLQIATVGSDGAPKLRTVVLREIDAIAGTLGFYTDSRSPKVAEIANDPRVSIVAFDLSQMLQIRLEGNAAVDFDEASRRSRWGTLRSHSVAIYRTRWAPGAIIGDQDAAAIREVQQNKDGFENFCVIRMVIDFIDFLELSAPDHVRYIFRRSAGEWSGDRVAP